MDAGAEGQPSRDAGTAPGGEVTDGPGTGGSGSFAGAQAPPQGAAAEAQRDGGYTAPQSAPFTGDAAASGGG